MPPDTTHIPGSATPPAPLLDSLAYVDRYHREDQFIVTYRFPAEAQSSHGMNDGLFALFMVIFVVVAIYRILRGGAIKRPGEITRKPTRGISREIPCDQWLSKYNPYYNSLPPEMKERFVDRTLRFMAEKEFRFHSMVEEEYIPVLISGAAVQMTFGLPNYHMDYFPVIHVIRKEYVLNIDKETYYGHVSRSGIYISWNHFMEGYKDYEDSVNVGLHEMAHAVSYDLFLGQQDHHDLAFRERLKGFTQVGTETYRSMKVGMNHLLDAYAITNFDEFWAVCVETFFENPEEFQQTLPELYQSVAHLLNQNPLKPEKIVDWELAGLAK